MKDCKNSRKRVSEDRGDLAAAKITSSEDKHSGIAGSQRGDFQWAVPQSLILGKHNPSSRANLTEPNTILLVASEMVVVKLDD
jgi:hypothetical protein